MTVISPTVTPEFSEAFELLEHTQQNVFLTGRAGTGKSTFLQYFRANSQKKLAVVAPTGVAALNVRGQTIHSFFRFKNSFIDIAEFKPIKKRLLKVLELLIIDEISMVRADLFDAIDLTLRVARQNEKPFGGVQLCIIGDLFQLPPVITNTEKMIYAEHYPSPFFFCTKSYAQADFKIVHFNTIHRQNDLTFIQLLNAVRSGNCATHELALLNKRVHPKVTAAPGTLILTTTNALAEHTNTTKLAQLTDPAQQYKASCSGDFSAKDGRLPAPENLILKPGAQVMFVKNDSELRWVNGTIGIVKKLTKETVTVQVGDISYDVGREKWKSIGYEFDETEGKIVEKALGTYTQFPLILAWAITIHKSQGKTLERVIIDLGNGAFAAGQLYVALSRCRSLNGIALKQPIKTADLRCDKQVVAFMKG